MEQQPQALEVTPENELTFNLSRGDNASSKCTMSLRHPGLTDEHLAFKVKTTQPRRYLVRPNQGLISPLNTEGISIFLVDKDKQTLLQSFDRLGQTALDHSKDKFLVQSCCVSREFATRYLKEKAKADKLTASNKDDAAAVKANKDLAEALTGMWNAVTSGGGTNPTFNKKLHVKHLVVDNNAAATAPASRGVVPPPQLTQQKKNHEPIDSMTPEQTYAELNSLRRKYDELVSFSVNLTAERDILNNTLEQTKRELNREMSNRSALENKIGSGGTRGGAGGDTSTKKKSMASSLVMALMTGIVFFLIGVKMTNNDQLPGFISQISMLQGPDGVDDNTGNNNNEQEL